MIGKCAHTHTDRKKNTFVYDIALHKARVETYFVHSFFLWMTLRMTIDTQFYFTLSILHATHSESNQTPMNIKSKPTIEPCSLSETSTFQSFDMWWIIGIATKKKRSKTTDNQIYKKRGQQWCNSMWLSSPTSWCMLKKCHQKNLWIFMKMRERWLLVEMRPMFCWLFIPPGWCSFIQVETLYRSNSTTKTQFDFVSCWNNCSITSEMIEYNTQQHL